jgi:hypothetical protein
MNKRQKVDTKALLNEVHGLIESGNHQTTTFDEKLKELYRAPPLTPHWKDVLMKYITEDEQKLLLKSESVYPPNTDQNDAGEEEEEEEEEEEDEDEEEDETGDEEDIEEEEEDDGDQMYAKGSNRK